MNFKKLLIVSAALLFGWSAQAQTWTQNPNFEGGNVKGFVKNGTTIYAATNGGVFMTTDNGSNWSFIGNGIGKNVGGLNVDRVLFTNSKLFAISGARLHRSADNGTTWISKNIPLKNMTDQVVSAETFNNAIYIVAGRRQGGGGGGGTNNNYLLKSTDDGDSFTELTTVPTKVKSGNLSVANNILFSTSDTIYSSTDGSTFTVYSNTGIPSGSTLSTVQGIGTSLFVEAGSFSQTGASANVYKLNPLTSTWTTSGAGLPTGAYLVGLSSAASTLFVGVLDITTFAFSYYKSSDLGTSWTQMAANGIAPVTVATAFTGGGLVVVAANTGTIMGGFPDGAFTTTDNGDNWTKKCTKLLATIHNQIVGNDAAVYATISAPASLQKSTDNGATYTTVADALFQELAATPSGLALAGTDLYVGFRLQGQGGGRDTMFLSKDGGSTFSTVDLPGMTGERYTLNGTSGTAVLLRGAVNQQGGGAITYYISKDKGATWVDLATPAGNINNLGGNGAQLFLSANNTGKIGIYCSQDNGGQSFKIDTVGLPKNIKAPRLAYSGDYIFLTHNDSTTGTIALYVQKNKTNWVKLPANNLPSGTSNYDGAVAVFAHNKAIYVNTSKSGLYISIDGGKNFTAYNAGLYDGLAKTGAAFSGSNALLATNGNGIWKNAALAGADPEVTFTTGIAAPSSLEKVIVAPNPANQFVTVAYQLTEKQSLSIRIVDLSGRVVKTIQNGTEAIGAHSTSIDLSDLENGLYYVQVISGSSASNHPVMVVR